MMTNITNLLPSATQCLRLPTEITTRVIHLCLVLVAFILTVITECASNSLAGAVQKACCQCFRAPTSQHNYKLVFVKR
jgi:hypothetical protein